LNPATGTRVDFDDARVSSIRICSRRRIKTLSDLVPFGRSARREFRKSDGSVWHASDPNAFAAQLKIVHRRFQHFGRISKHPPAQFSARRSDRATSSLATALRLENTPVP
jgi:hypothetical protein